MAPTASTVAVMSIAAVVVVGQLYATIPQLDDLAEESGVRSAAAAWASTAFGFAYALGMLVAGPLSDAVGRRRVAGSRGRAAQVGASYRPRPQPQNRASQDEPSAGIVQVSRHADGRLSRKTRPEPFPVRGRQPEHCNRRRGSGMWGHSSRFDGGGPQAAPTHAANSASAELPANVGASNPGTLHAGPSRGDSCKSPMCWLSQACRPSGSARASGQSFAHLDSSRAAAAAAVVEMQRSLKIPTAVRLGVQDLG